MSFILTLVTSQMFFADGFLSGIEYILDEGRARVEDRRELAMNRAMDFILTDTLTEETWHKVSDLCDQAKVDRFFQENVGRRRKRLLMADMDSTIVTTETLDEVAGRFGLGEKVSEITARAMRGELDFKSSLRERMALLAGADARQLEIVREDMVLSTGARALIATMKAHSGMCVLVSGGFTFFTGHVAKLCGFDHHHGNIMQIEGGQITGHLVEPVLDRSAKLTLMGEYCTKYRCKPEDVLAIGDGANDRDMIVAAGLGIGFHPKGALLEATHNHIRYGDLTAALYAQGYHENEIKKLF
ncbi:MAG: phosphoserine phosphatase SerB [Pseudobdellovibrionaceae bacterium]